MPLTIEDASVAITFALRGIEICRLAGLEISRANVEAALRPGLVPSPLGDALLTLALEQFDKMMDGARNMSAGSVRH